MRKIIKRGFCLFLVAVLLAGLVPSAFADESKATQTTEATEAAKTAEPSEETTAPTEAAEATKDTEPTETTAPATEPKPTEATEATEPEVKLEEPPEDDAEDNRLLSDGISTYASTVSNVLLFDQASPNYTTVLSSQVSVTYQPNGTDAAKTAYIKNLGWHFARYNNVPYEDDPLYCIEPHKNYAASTSGNYMDQDLGVSGSGGSRGSNVWYAMPSSYRNAIALTLLYSRQLWDSNYSVKTTAMANNPNVSTRIATQFLIYEIVTGLRDADTFNRHGSNGYTNGDVFYNAGVASVSGFAEKYNSIVSSVQNAMKIPSFTSRSSSAAPTVTMSGNQVSVTDSNGVLGNFSFTNGNGASFSKSGNTLTITKTGSISPTALFSATRSLPSAENSTVSIYYSASSTYQTCVKLYSPQVDTLRAYFRINAPDPKGAVKITKVTNTGQNLGGWKIGLYTDAACTQPISSSPFATRSDGTVTVSGLQPGTYYAKELPSGDPYWVCDTGVKKATVAVGQTAAVSFTNIQYGALEIRKSTTINDYLGGWHFIVKAADGTEVPGSPFISDESGLVKISNLAPGKYLIMEAPTENPYWTTELGFHTVTVEYGKTAVDRWTNKALGMASVVKATNTGDALSGWHITIYADEVCTQEVHTLITEQDGTAGIYLDPGTYWVKETGSEEVRDDYWKMDDTLRKIEVCPLEQTILKFVNNYSGRIALQKTVEPVGKLEGWQFKITDAKGKAVAGSPFVTDQDGKFLTPNLLPGTYTVEEILPEDSLYTAETPKAVTVTAGSTATVSFVNRLRTGKITIRKVDSSDEPLQGATFLLEGSEDGSFWYPIIPDAEGLCILSARTEEHIQAASRTSGTDGLLIWENLIPKYQYRITEVKAPEGYTLLKDYAFVGTLPNDTLELELRVVNGKSFALPKTSSAELSALPTAAVTCLLLCTASFYLLRRKEQ